MAKVFSAQLSGLRAHIITIEVDLSNGLHAFSVVGLGDKAIDESKDRVAAAIKNSGYTSPKQKNQKVVISLAPADLRKEGPAFDLGMALGYLLASDDVNFDPAGKIFLGELSLEGNVRKIHGILPLIKGIREQGYTEVFIPHENAREAGLIKGISIYPVQNLKQLLGHLADFKGGRIPTQKATLLSKSPESHPFDFSMIRAQETPKRALEIAAAGRHNVGMYGPPGTGKTMLAKAFPSILPDLSHEEMLEVTGIHSIAKTLEKPFVTRPPFRAPHHTSSYASLVGGGSFPRPGEITLAHRGVLFLDEFPEFDQKVIEALRQPLEDKEITIARARGSSHFPAECIVMLSMNPCPCGYGKERGCTCSVHDIARYHKKISGPILDRIDLWVSVSKIKYGELSSASSGIESSATVRKRVEKVRLVQKERCAYYKIPEKYNSELTVSDMEKCITLKKDALATLKNSAERLELSARMYHRTIKMARTIADLEGNEGIRKEHILEALQFRPKIF